MRPNLTGTKKRPSVAKPAGAEAALSLQEELVAAIQGAFEVAVEIAIQEVTKLVGPTTGDDYEKMRRENESLKQRLQRAEAMLGFVSMEERGSSPPHAKQLLDATSHTGQQQPHTKCSQKRPDPGVEDVYVRAEVKYGINSAEPPPDPQQKPRNQEQSSIFGVKAQLSGEDASEKRWFC